MDDGLHEPTGNGKQDEWARKLIRWVKRQTLLNVIGGTKQQRHNGYNLIINARGGGAPGDPGTLPPFTIVLIKGDYLVCTPRDGGAQVNVAKSPCLWQSTRSAVIEGITITYTNAPYVGGVGEFSRRDATAQGITVKEEVTPPYIVGQPIYAMKVVGGTGASIPTGAVDWVSVADPRAWATRADQST